jgi:16S rRNA (uracil1498-N3)-methyltransferase
MGPGDRLTVFNGDGGEYAAAIVSAERREVTIDVAEFSDQDCESPLAIELGIAVSRGERMDWIVQKSTELGVTAIIPLLTERVEVKLNAERSAKRQHHWQQVAVSACEQCGRNRLPRIAAITSVAEWLPSARSDLRLVLHHRAAPAGESTAQTPGSVSLLVGPEGGLSDGEIAAAEAAGFNALQLGPRVLRTETAPLAALAMLQSRWGDMT